MLRFLSSAAINALAVALSSTSAFATGSTTTITTPTVTATPSGGVPPYTFLWTIITADEIIIVSPTASATAFRKATTYAGQTYTGTAKVEVKDSVNTTVISGNVNVSITHRESTTRDISFL